MLMIVIFINLVVLDIVAYKILKLSSKTLKTINMTDLDDFWQD